MVTVGIRGEAPRLPLWIGDYDNELILSPTSFLISSLLLPYLPLPLDAWCAVCSDVE